MKFLSLSSLQVCIALVANKCDLLKSIVNCPLVAEAQAYCKTLDRAVHYQTSAKRNLGLDEMFLDLTRRMIEYQRLNTRSSSITSFGGGRTLRLTDEEEPINTDAQTDAKRCSC